MPDWLAPWNSTAQRQRKLEAECTNHRVPAGYANATLCGLNRPSPLLAAAMGAGLAPACGAPCVYNPAPAPGNDTVTAWRFDQDNQCWLQDSRAVQACPLGSAAAAAVDARAALLWRQKQFADFLNTTETRKAWQAVAAGGSEADPTGAGAQEALAQALVDGFATDAALAKLRALPPDSRMARLQAGLQKEAG